MKIFLIAFAMLLPFTLSGGGISIQNSDAIRNKSTVPGATVTDALNNLVVGGGIFQWQEFTVSYSDLAAAATGNDIALYTLPAKTALMGVYIKHTTPFSGGGISSYSVSVGISGRLERYASAFDVLQAVGDTAHQDSQIFFTPSESATTQIRISAKTSSINLDQATGGSATIRLLTSTM